MLEQEQPDHENSHESREPQIVPLEKPRSMRRSALRSYVTPIALAVAAIALLVYGLHERSVAAHYSVQNAEAAAQTKDLRAQLGAVTARLDAMSSPAQQPASQSAPASAP